MKTIDIESLTKVMLCDPKDIFQVKDIKILFKNLENVDKDLNKYILSHCLQNKYKPIEVKFIYDMSGKLYIYIYDRQLAQVLVIEEDTDNLVLIDTRMKKYSVSEFLDRIITYFNDINTLITDYNFFTKSYMDRDYMINFIKRFNYIPITHEYFDNDEYIFSDRGIIKDENGCYFEDWGYNNGADIHNGIRMRSEGNWNTGWKIKVFDNWYNEILKISKEGY